MTLLPLRLDSAYRHYEATRAQLGTASREHRASLALLAAEIRHVASDELGSVNALCELVERRAVERDPDSRVKKRTVRNALYETFVPEHLTACVEALAAVRTGSGLPQAA